MHANYVTQQKQQKIKLGVLGDLVHKLMLQFMFINVLSQQNSQIIRHRTAAYTIQNASN